MAKIHQLLGNPSTDASSDASDETLILISFLAVAVRASTKEPVAISVQLSQPFAAALSIEVNRRAMRP
jgi:hypothetical protein